MGKNNYLNKNIINKNIFDPDKDKSLIKNKNSIEKINNILNKIINIYYMDVHNDSAYKDNQNFIKILKIINKYIESKQCNKNDYDFFNLFYKDLESILKKQKKIVNLDKFVKKNQYLVTIGDIHGDLITVLKIFSKFNIEENSFIFLGDYVDRGNFSLEVTILLLLLKVIFPQKIFILAGNHECFNTIKVFPSDFWYSKKYLENKQFIDNVFNLLPLVAYKEKTLFLHGVAPEIDNFDKLLSFFALTQKTSELYKKNSIIIEKILWGDFIENDSFFNGYHQLSGRPQHGKSYFEKTLSALGFKYLVRGHQQTVKGLIFDNRCLTIFSSEYYKNSGLTKGIFVYITNEFSQRFNPDLIINI